MAFVKTEVDKKYLFCQGCLSSDRKISPIRENSEIFYYLLGDQHQLMEAKDIMLCWECTAMLKRIQIFQNQVKSAHFAIFQLLYQMDEQPPTLSSLEIMKKDYYDYTIEHEEPKCQNNETEIKNDVSDIIIKQEVEDIEADTDNQILELITKEKNEYSETEFDNDSPVIEKSLKSIEKTEEIKKQSIKRYQNYATVSKNLNIDCGNIDSYYVKVYLNEKELEDVMKRDRRDCGYDRMPYKCVKCKLGYKRSIDFNRHNAVHHYTTRPFRCTECKTIKTSHTELLEHWRRHSSMLQCNLCSSLCRSRGEIRKHLNRFHTTLYSCNCCKETFSTLREFSNHYKRDHERLICDYCSKSFLLKKSLEIHIKRHHIPPTCTECNRTYAHYHVLENHYRMYHPHLISVDTRREMSYCVECDKQYSNVYRYKRHLAQSVKHKPPKRVRVPCPDCGKVFTRTTYMNNHYRLVHVKDTKHHCEICKKYFATGYAMRKHKQYVHEKERMPKNKMCDICGRGFGTKRILENHRRTHTGERPYKCVYCPATFAQETAMKTHQKTQHKNLLNLDLPVQ